MRLAKLQCVKSIQFFQILVVGTDFEGIKYNFSNKHK